MSPHEVYALVAREKRQVAEDCENVIESGGTEELAARTSRSSGVTVAGGGTWALEPARSPVKLLSLPQVKAPQSYISVAKTKHHG